MRANGVEESFVALSEELLGGARAVGFDEQVRAVDPVEEAEPRIHRGGVEEFVRDVDAEIRIDPDQVEVVGAVHERVERKGVVRDEPQFLVLAPGDDVGHFDEGVEFESRDEAPVMVAVEDDFAEVALTQAGPGEGGPFGFVRNRVESVLVSEKEPEGCVLDRRIEAVRQDAVDFVVELFDGHVEPPGASDEGVPDGRVGLCAVGETLTLFTRIKGAQVLDLAVDRFWRAADHGGELPAGGLLLGERAVVVEEESQGEGRLPGFPDPAVPGGVGGRLVFLLRQFP